ncbi:pilus assembly protein PilV [Alteromonadaceae bacterium M269]|nr:pilus assembly protein PilV [Alteromonadaceae bacterium M269]
MVEVLVTLFILSIGLLGVASLQFIGSLSNADALNRSQSVLVAQQLTERLRAASVMSQAGDGQVVANEYFDAGRYNFNNLSCPGGGNPFDCFCIEIPNSVRDCRGQNCSAAELATFDAYEVSCSAVSSNPEVTIGLSCEDNNLLDVNSCSAGSKHSVILRWPTQNWQNTERRLNAECNVDASEPMDCVIVDVTL